MLFTKARRKAEKGFKLGEGTVPVKAVIITTEENENTEET